MQLPGKSLIWIGTSKQDFMKFPTQVHYDVGYALYLAQMGRHPAGAKAMKGFGGAGVIEVIENLQGDTYRAVYTVKIDDAICVLHCFRKKSSSGKATSRQDMATIKSRLAQALKEHGK